MLMAEQKRKPGRPKGSKNKATREKLDAELAKKQAQSRLKNEIWAIVIMAVGAFLAISLHTQAAGELGRIISDLLKGLFAAVAYALPYYLILYGLMLFFRRSARIGARSVLLLCLIFLMTTVINSARYLDVEGLSISLSFIKDAYNNGVVLEGGGAFGMTLGLVLKKAIGIPGLYILSLVVIVISLMLVVNIPASQFIERYKEKRREAMKDKETAADAEATADTSVIMPDPVEKAAIEVPGFLSGSVTNRQMKIIDYVKDDELFETGQKSEGLGLEKPAPVEPGKGLTGDEETAKEKPVSKKSKGLRNEEVEELKIDLDKEEPISYIEPPIDLLDKAKSVPKTNENINLKQKALKLEETLKNFGVNAKVVQVTKGPAITRYEIQPSVGVKVSSIVRLADDIALNLKAKSIRMEAPIPGKAAVGIEVENDRVNLVTIRELIETKEFQNSPSKITFAVGKDIAGTPVVADLKSMPHLLIAGSTGSGKSVCLNSIIVSILYKARPDEVKLVLIDPKVVELGNYNGIPHLLIPVVTEPSKAAAALSWAVSEMTERYRKFAELGVRDLDSYNEHIKTKDDETKPMPQIVIIIDELADLMMVAPSQVEESICRLAQMARAAGMHLIVATQRPSVDIITGVIKANIPSRISFAVSSQFDSRTILDMAGAEKLVGKGDMLFYPLGESKPIRVQGCFISDGEVHKVIDYLKEQVPDNEYATDVIQRIERSYESDTDDDTDELLQEAIETVVRAEQASVSMLQRRFRIGYNRAARLIDMMEARGIVGPSEGSRPRKVLMTEEEFLNLGKDPDDKNEN
jgi:S-DNA-T family DNA segregation ATPase FtsK/SpoIIIE